MYPYRSGDPENERTENYRQGYGYRNHNPRIRVTEQDIGSYKNGDNHRDIKGIADIHGPFVKPGFGAERLLAMSAVVIHFEHFFEIVRITIHNEISFPAPGAFCRDRTHNS